MSVCGSTGLNDTKIAAIALHPAAKLERKEAPRCLPENTLLGLRRFPVRVRRFPCFKLRENSAKPLFK
jgi:hypothetical protein